MEKSKIFRVGLRGGVQMREQIRRRTEDGLENSEDEHTVSHRVWGGTDCC